MSTRSRVDLTTPGAIDGFIADAAARGCNHLLGMLRAVRAGRINLLLPLRATAFVPVYRFAKQGRPVAVLVGDDDYRPAGPSTWASAVRLRAWARFAIVHGTGAEDWQYAMATEAAVDTGRLLFIETTSAGAQDWAGFLRERTPALPMMGFLPPDGVHPVMPAKGDLH